MTGITRDDSGWYHINRPLDDDLVDGLRSLGRIERLCLSGVRMLSIVDARRLSELRVEWLRLWCMVTPRALRHVLRIRDLRQLHVLELRSARRMPDIGIARDLADFSESNGIGEAGLLQVARCRRLTTLSVHGAALTRSSLSALLALPNLTHLDLEGSNFDDAMAKRLGRSTTIAWLDVGATKITGAGMAHLVRMQQLRGLDLWATAIADADLPLLLNLPQLEYLALHGERLSAAAIVDLVLAASSLKRLWLDKVQFDDAQHRAVEAKLASLRIDNEA